MPIIIGLILLGFLGITFLTLTINNKSVDKIIKQEAIQCIEGSKGKDSMGDCRILNIHSAYIDSKDKNITVVFYNQGIFNPDHVLEIKNNKVIDHTGEELHGKKFNEFKKILDKRGDCIIYEATIYKYNIIQSNKNRICDWVNLGQAASKYDEYLTKVIKYKNENKSLLKSGSCLKVMEKINE